MTTHNLDDVAAAYLQTHNAFQQLTFLLERKGIITTEELAAIYGETPEGSSVRHKHVLELVNANIGDLQQFGLVAFEMRKGFRAGSAGERATCERCCAHSVITSQKSPVFARDSGMLADSQSVDPEVIA